MARLFVAAVCLLVAAAPAGAQGSLSEYYKNKYGSGSQPDQKSTPYGRYHSQYQRGQYQAQPANPYEPALQFSGAPSPANMPNENMKGFGQKSHWLDRPGASSNIGELSSQVESLIAKHMQAKSAGNLPGAAQSNAALQNVLRQLKSMEPRNAKWHLLEATTFINQAGGPSRSGTAGDRASLKMAIRELDMAAACPNAGEFASQIANIKATTQKELDRRVAKGIEIQRRGASQFAKIYNMPGGESTGSSTSLCTVCGHFHGTDAGECNYRRD